MSKAGQNPDTGRKRTLPLLELIAQATNDAPTPVSRGVMDLDTAFRAALADAMKACPLSRAQIADELGRLVDRPVGEATLNAWCSDSKDAHRFPASYLPAFCRITGSITPLMVLAGGMGAHVVDGTTVLLAERARRERRIAAERRALKALDAALPEELP